eukprot:TRINITY_DN16879_c0_g1_i2.p1 TRINITY_DN16879_c0_g1~~TRINITY_DN16879_c0_g1_i2.p1  ORF type:complete len:208 (-),score=3.01 TRINITY_DN16879_c0_g1_i2:182-805(-)
MFKIKVSDEKGDTLAETAWVTQTKPRGLSALHKAHVFNVAEIPRPPPDDEGTEDVPLTPEEELKVDPRHGKKHEAYRCPKHGVVHTNERVSHDCSASDNDDPAPASSRDLPVPAHGLPVPPPTSGPALLRSPRSGGPHNTNIEQMMAELAVRRVRQLAAPPSYYRSLPLTTDPYHAQCFPRSYAHSPKPVILPATSLPSLCSLHRIK